MKKLNYGLYLFLFYLIIALQACQPAKPDAQELRIRIKQGTTTQDLKKLSEILDLEVNIPQTIDKYLWVVVPVPPKPGPQPIPSPELLGKLEQLGFVQEFQVVNKYNTNN